MPKADITAEIPPLPEGWRGSPDELLEFFKNNVIFNFDGDFPTGQVGGARPTEDIGIWYGDNSIEKFRGGKYRPISDVPIGALMPWASVSAAIPENYLLCDGRSLIRTEFPELFTVIGEAWGFESATTFNLPDLRGRHPVGAGTGDYKAQGIVGLMKKLTAGTYTGFEWPVRTPLFPNAPTKSMKVIATPASKKDFLSIRSPSVVMPWIIRYR